MSDALAFLSEDARRAIEQLVDRRVEERLAELAATTEPTFLTVPEAAERLRARPQRVYDLLSAGRLTRHKDGTRVLVSRAELDSYLGRPRHGSRRRRDL